MKKLVSILTLSAVLVTGSTFGQDKPMHEVYSMMVYNFVKYIQWPNQGGEFVIGIVGNDEMFATMNKVYTGSKLGSSTCVVKQYKSASEIGECQVVFIDKSKSSEFDAINAKVRGKNTLVITDKNGLGAKGSGINFKVVENKLRFELNQKAIAEANLKAAGALTSMAILI